MRPGDLAAYRPSSNYDHIVSLLNHRPIPRNSLVVVLCEPDTNERVQCYAINDGRHYGVPKRSLHRVK